MIVGPPGSTMSGVDLLTLSRVVSALAISVGVVFGLIQLRNYRDQRRREACLTLVRSFQTPQFASALRVLFELPFGLTRERLETEHRDALDSVWLLLSTWESIGILVHRGEVPIDMVDDFFFGPITVTWRKTRRYVEAVREEQERETIAEWSQWLAERMLRQERSESVVPAYVAHRNWEPE